MKNNGFSFLSGFWEPEREKHEEEKESEAANNEPRFRHYIHKISLLFMKF